MERDAPLVLLDSDPREGVASRVLHRQEVKTTVCVFDVRRRVRSEALYLGFPRLVAEELTIVASELCSNILKYGVHGEVALDAIEHGARGPALVIAASDHGPPFRAFERAVRDRSDDRGTIPPEAMYTRRGIGGGLGAVRRLSDGIFLTQSASGKSIVVVRYVGTMR